MSPERTVITWFVAVWMSILLLAFVAIMAGVIST
ncbi:hypothetical protein C497_03570 [Halalkalicoccus jeotgali B3]|uniref:DUF2474 domain-containing protein n=1 Tax=Halalkalicoccus jeotgali (strain DSM 18796 / CECT 7217 / JCM 14584 / KCTC 4019 / B3) TaxID=795797 RepID=D8J9L6_HALJB|nr:hypothetical protein HacjB3_05185 [Halalkalicoccus jeotgali B3]ELY40144.1 hypothetical protein C497_03570 [Halalkalicoccus jeotgali B3]